MEKETFVPIMNGTNSHDEVLVERINNAYRNRPSDFQLIMTALMARDIDECLEHGIAWTNDVHTYLMQIADDKDLETILSFLRL